MTTQTKLHTQDPKNFVHTEHANKSHRKPSLFKSYGRFFHFLGKITNLFSLFSASHQEKPVVLSKKEKIFVSPHELNGLQALSDLIDGDDEAKENAIHFLRDYLRNKKICRILHKINRNFKIKQSLKKEGVLNNTGALELFLSCLAHYDTHTALVQKAENLLKKVENGEDIKREDKLSLKEWRILEGYADHLKQLNDLLGRLPLKREGLLSKNEISDIQALFQKAVQVHQSFSELWHKKIRETDSYQTGDIVLVPFYPKLNSSQGHVEKVYFDEVEPKPKLSHATRKRGYQNEYLRFENVRNFEIWRIDVCKLLKTEESDSDYHKLLEIYKKKHPKTGEKRLHKHIQRLYRKIEIDMHTEIVKKDEITAVKVTRKKLSYTTLAVCSLGKLQRKRKSRVKQDRFDKIHERFITGERKVQPNWKTTCSSFATKATIAGLVELDFQLSRELAKRRGQDEHFVESSNNLRFLTLPFDSHERLKRIDPARMLSLLQRKDCIRKIDQSEMRRFYRSIIHD